MSTIGREVCPHCGQTINKRKIVLYRGMVVALGEIYKWCREKNRHEFTRKEIKHVLKTDGQIARFGDWVMFGGLLYKGGKAQWGMNMERTQEFLRCKLAIPSVVVKDPITGEVVDRQDYRKINQIKGLLELLDADGAYIAEYVGQTTLI